MAKVPPVVAEEDPSRKRKADEVAAPTDSAKRAKGDDVVTVSDDTAVAPSEPPTLTEVASKTKEGVDSPDVAEPAPSGAAASAATFPRFMARGFPGVADNQSPQSLEIVDEDIGSRPGCTSFTVPSTDAADLHKMLSAAIQVCPVPEFLVAEFQRLGIRGLERSKKFSSQPLKFSD